MKKMKNKNRSKMTEAKMRKQIEGTQFQIDLEHTVSMNGKPMAQGMWNLILSKRDCTLYAKGIRPHRMWKIGDVKWYFGIKGGAEKCAEQLEDYLAIITKANQIEAND